MVVPWHDAIVEAVGFDVRSNYVELFWLNVLGQTNCGISARSPLRIPATETANSENPISAVSAVRRT